MYTAQFHKKVKSNTVSFTSPSSQLFCRYEGSTRCHSHLHKFLQCFCNSSLYRLLQEAIQDCSFKRRLDLCEINLKVDTYIHIFVLDICQIFHQNRCLINTVKTHWSYLKNNIFVSVICIYFKLSCAPSPFRQMKGNSIVASIFLSEPQWVEDRLQTDFGSLNFEPTSRWDIFTFKLPLLYTRSRDSQPARGSPSQALTAVCAAWLSVFCWESNFCCVVWHSG